MRILILYWHPDFMGPMRAAVQQHLHVLDASETPHEVVYCRDNSPNDPLPPPANPHFDAVILHNTFLGMRWQPWFYSWKAGLTWVRDLTCPKIAMPQDEYDHAGVLDEWLFDWGVTIVFTNFNAAQRKLLYPLLHHKAVFYPCFTGYIDEAAAKQIEPQLRPLSDRPYDIVYRATHLPYWFGQHGQLKHQIAEAVGARAQAQGLKFDISTRAEDAILGSRWLDFLASGRVVIGCESGSSVLDRRGEIKAQIQAMQQQNPGLSFAQANAQLPANWDSYSFFAISPRHFEAVLTKTCQVLVEGEYDHVFEPNRHYLPLRRDFSNLDKILIQLQNHQYLQEIADCAYHEIYLSGQYTYRTLAEQIEQALLDQQKINSQATLQPKTMTEPELKQNLIDTLERQIVVERHLQAALQETKERLSKLEGKVEAMEAERAVMRAERKKWLILATVILLCALVATALVSALITYLILTNLGMG